MSWATYSAVLSARVDHESYIVDAEGAERRQRVHDAERLDRLAITIRKALEAQEQSK